MCVNRFHVACVFVDSVGVPDGFHHDGAEDPAAQEKSPERGTQEDRVILWQLLTRAWLEVCVLCVYCVCTVCGPGARGPGAWEGHSTTADLKRKGDHIERVFAFKFIAVIDLTTRIKRTRWIEGLLVVLFFSLLFNQVDGVILYKDEQRKGRCLAIIYCFHVFIFLIRYNKASPVGKYYFMTIIK